MARDALAAPLQFAAQQPTAVGASALLRREPDARARMRRACEFALAAPLIEQTSREARCAPKACRPPVAAAISFCKARRSRTAPALPAINRGLVKILGLGAPAAVTWRFFAR